MSKITLGTVTNGQDLGNINNNFALIAQALNQNVLYRLNVNTEPNQIQNDIDFNGYKAYNLSDVSINGVSVLTVLNGASTSATQAAASAVIATTQAGIASSSATASAASASSAAGSASAASATLASSLLKANNLSDLPNVVAAKANLALVKGDVGLGNVDNTSDVNKPVSTAQATSIATKLDSTVAATTYAPKASPTFTGTVVIPTVTLSGGTINGTTVGATTPSAGTFTGLSANGNEALYYFLAAGPSLATGVSVQMVSWTKQFDRLNANFNATTGVYTCPSSGWYSINGQISIANGTNAVNAQFTVSLYINGSSSAVATVFSETANSSNITIPYNFLWNLNATNTVTIVVTQSTGGTRFAANGITSTLNIVKIP